VDKNKPIFDFTADDYGSNSGETYPYVLPSCNLTKRELFAAMAMQAIVGGNFELAEKRAVADGVTIESAIALLAVKQADELLDELESTE
jgi:hypothetical protein